MELPTSLSTIFHHLFDLIKKFLVSGAVSDFIHKLSDLTDTFLASDTVVHVLQWFKKANVPTMVAVVVIVLLFLSCCGCLAKIVVVHVLQWFKKENVLTMVAVVVIVLLFLSCCGCLAKSVKTMKAPGRSYRIPRSNFEANPSAYFRDLRKR
ncbi:hypothetical protein NC651_040578 [Populus alba x Populus x berolinensis]|nr:hypothetical protein NC651_040578 [Populus alba x Populus x berolinensis]